MELRVKPLIILDSGNNVFWRPDGTREIVTDEKDVAVKVSQLSKELRAKLKFSSALLEDSIVQGEQDLATLKSEALQADALLVYLIGAPSVEVLFRWGRPIIAFSGQYTPTWALYAFGVERQVYPGVTIAVDYKDIDDTLQILNVKKKLEDTRIVLFGFPSPWFSQWHHLPDIELAEKKLGVTFSGVELRDLLAQLPLINNKEAEAVAKRWQQEAKEVIEPSKSDVVDAARVYLAITETLGREKANALAINCLDMRRLEAPPPCYALTRLRDQGIPSACEGDITALLTMLLLGYLAEAPSFMGNIVGVIPDSNILRISHDVVPIKMSGFGRPANAYTLRSYHDWSRGVTAYVELDHGQEVTVARLDRNLDQMLILRGELVDCQDTVACRSTLSIKGRGDVREFVRRCFGIHHVVIYGNLTAQIEALSELLGINCIKL